MVSSDGPLPKHVRDRKDPTVLAEYNLPYLGHVSLLDDSNSPSAMQINGAYWARVEKIGAVGRYSSSRKELVGKVSEEIITFLLRKRKELSDEVHQIDNIIPTTSIGIIKSGDWMDQYKQGDKK